MHASLPPPPQVKFSGRRWNSISDDAKDCIRAMLEVDPHRRPTAQKVEGPGGLGDLKDLMLKCSFSSFLDRH